MINEIKSRSIITKSNLPDTDYVVNPYGGCTHNCIYCYARFMKRFSGHDEDWGKFLDVKINSVDLVPAKTNRYRGKSIFLSSVTDPYQPVERKYELTRRILAKLIPLRPSLGVQTKSDLILRDIDLLKQFRDAEVGITITTLDDNIRKEIEPCASSPEKRIDALKKLKNAELKTYVFVGPILPFITDWKKIVEQTKDFVDFYYFENLNVRGSIWQDIKKWLTESHPELLSKYEEIYFTKNDYWNKVEKEIEKFSKSQNIESRIHFHH